MSTAEFLKLWQESPEQITRTRVIPPKLGESGFGEVYVEFKLPLAVLESKKRMKQQKERAEFV